MKRSIVVTGVPAIDKKLKTLATRVQNKVVRRSMRDGMKIIKAAVQSEATFGEYSTGLTRSSIKVRALKRSRKRMGIEVTISGKIPGLIKPSAGGPTFYPAVVEYGRKGVPANPFMRRAFASKGEQARQVTLEKLRDGVEEEAGKL